MASKIPNTEFQTTDIEPKKIQSGDELALAEMVRAELPRIYNLCIRLCRNADDASDLCQDSFVKAIRHIQKFRGESQLSTWLYRITINTWKNRVRSEKRRYFSSHFTLTKTTNDEEEKEIPLKEKTPNPEEALEQSETVREILKALDKLDPDEKSIIVLKDIENRSYDDISEILQLKLGTVKSQLSRARNRLRDVHNRMQGRTD